MDSNKVYDNADAYQCKCYETVNLPNGGTVMLDKLAFETFQGHCISSHKINSKYVWKVTLDFDGDKVETATVDRPSNVELR